MAGITQLIETAIFNRLGGTAGLGGLKIYNKIAPSTVNPPYIIFQWQGGGDENLTPSRMVNAVFTVKGVGLTQAQAHTADENIDSALHNQTLTVTGWENFWTAREDMVDYDEVEDTGQVIYHVGGIYRVRIGQ